MHSRFVSSVWKSEEQSDKQGKRGTRQNSQGCREETPQSQRKVYFTFEFMLTFQVFISFYILVIVIVTIMADKINNKNIANNSTEFSLKTPFRVHQTTKNHNHLLSLMGVQ